MAHDSVNLCQQLREEAAEAVRLAATISDKEPRGALLTLARDLSALAMELEAASAVAVSKGMNADKPVKPLRDGSAE